MAEPVSVEDLFPDATTHPVTANPTDRHSEAPVNVRTRLRGDLMAGTPPVAKLSSYPLDDASALMRCVKELGREGRPRQGLH